jgi:hypothetical protein
MFLRPQAPVVALDEPVLARHAGHAETQPHPAPRESRVVVARRPQIDQIAEITWLRRNCLHPGEQVFPTVCVLAADRKMVAN